MFCKNCGKQIPKGEKKCPNCGYNESNNQSSVQKLNSNQILISAQESKKLELVNLGLHIIALLLGLILLFFPLFEMQVQSEDDLAHIELDEFGELWENDGIVKFSYFNETVRIIKQITAKNSTVPFRDVFFSTFLGYILLMAELVVLICFGIRGITKSVNAIMDIEKTRTAHFLRIGKYPKDAILETRSFFDIVFVVLIAVIDVLFVFGNDVVSRKMIPRKGFDLASVSPSFILVVLLLIGFFALKAFAKQTDTEIKKEVAKRRKEQKEENRRKNEEAHQKNLERKNAQLKQEELKQNESNDNQQPAPANDPCLDEQEHKQAEDFTVELKKLKELLDANIITQEDFDAKKKQLLGL